MGKMTVKETVHVIERLSWLIIGEGGRNSE